MRGCATLMGASEGTSETKVGGYATLMGASEGTSETKVGGYATLMGASEGTSETKGWGGERLSDFDGGLLKLLTRLLIIVYPVY